MIRLLTAVFLFASFHVVADTEVPHTFQEGEVIDAQKFNEDFNALEAAIDANAAALPPTNCTTDQIIKWNGSAWACAEDITLQSVRDAVDRRSTTSTNANVVVYCDPGEKVTGGGYRDDSGGAAPYLCETFVPAPEGSPTDGYRCKWANDGVSRTVYAICL